MSLQHNMVLFGAAMLAGAVNSVAGGGTLLTFPALLMTGQLANVANATSTVALWPGQLSSLWGYRKEIGQSRTAILALGLPSLIGGGAGALLFARTPNDLFARIIPFLILLATLLFMVQGPISRRLRAQAQSKEEKNKEGVRCLVFGVDSEVTEPNKEQCHSPDKEEESPNTKHQTPDTRLPAAWLGVMVFQLLVAIYGGYFGAGIGILMLAALGFMGFTDIHRMNGLKNINGLLINAVAIVIFVTAHTPPGQGGGPGHDRLVDWPIAGLMALGSIIGGYTGAGTARRIGQQNVRRIVILIGLSLTLSLLLPSHTKQMAANGPTAETRPAKSR